MPGRILTIGDIHGCDVALETLLNRLSVTTEDTVIALGDVVDRGPNVKRAVELLLELKEHCELVFILGNHEEMLLDACQKGLVQTAWLQYGGAKTLQSYGGGFFRIPPEHFQFFESACSYWQSDSHILVHASLDPDVSLEDQTAWQLRWTRVRGNEPPHPSGKQIICGHSAQHSGTPLVWPGWVCLDTWVYRSGWLTGLDLETGELIQTQQSGAYRDGMSISLAQPQDASDPDESEP